MDCVCTLRWIRHVSKTDPKNDTTISSSTTEQMKCRSQFVVWRAFDKHRTLFMYSLDLIIIYFLFHFVFAFINMTILIPHCMSSSYYSSSIHSVGAQAGNTLNSCEKLANIKLHDICFVHHCQGPIEIPSNHGHTDGNVYDPSILR